MKAAAFVILLLSAPAQAIDQCQALADLAANVAEHRDAGVPQVHVASQLRAQYQEHTARQRAHNAMVEKMLPLVYDAQGTPASVRRAVLQKCSRGEFKSKPREKRHVD